MTSQPVSTATTQELEALRFALNDCETIAGDLRSSMGEQLTRQFGDQLSDHAKRTHAPLDPLSLSEMPTSATVHDDVRERDLACEAWPAFARRPAPPGADPQFLAERSVHVVTDEDGESLGFTKRDVADAAAALRALGRGTPRERLLDVALRLAFGAPPPGEPIAGFDVTAKGGKWRQERRPLPRIWPLGRLTDRVERLRQELVGEEVDRQYARWKANGGQFARGSSPSGVMEKIRRGAEAGISSADALHAGLGHHDKAFLRDVRREAQSLLAEALAAFAVRMRGALSARGESAREAAPPVTPAVVRHRAGMGDLEWEVADFGALRGVSTTQATEDVKEGLEHGLLVPVPGRGKALRVALSDDAMKYFRQRMDRLISNDIQPVLGAESANRGGEFQPLDQLPYEGIDVPALTPGEAPTAADSTVRVSAGRRPDAVQGLSLFTLDRVGCQGAFMTGLDPVPSHSTQGNTTPASFLSGTNLTWDGDRQ